MGKITFLMDCMRIILTPALVRELLITRLLLAQLFSKMKITQKQKAYFITLTWSESFLRLHERFFTLLPEKEPILSREHF